MVDVFLDLAIRARPEDITNAPLIFLIHQGVIPKNRFQRQPKTNSTGKGILKYENRITQKLTHQSPDPTSFSGHLQSNNLDPGP
jgi:hypothetical protein